MQALVLVGGEGTRLRPLTDNVPKPALPIAGRPMIAYMIEWLASHGVDEVVLACGFKAERLEEVLGDGEPGWPRLRYLTEPEPLGTAGAIRFAADLLEDRFLAMNGDVLADLDLSELMRVHEEKNATATIGLYPVEDANDYGLVRTDENGAVVEFLEKPGADDREASPARTVGIHALPPSPIGGHLPAVGNPPNNRHPEGALATEGSGLSLINAGCYCLERSILDLIPPDRAVSIEREVFPQLIGKGLYGVRLEGYWLDIGTHERYEQADRDILAGKVKT
jgi:mannose-1-phosphate guanylyltransferase